MPNKRFETAMLQYHQKAKLVSMVRSLRGLGLSSTTPGDEQMDQEGQGDPDQRHLGDVARALKPRGRHHGPSAPIEHLEHAVHARRREHHEAPEPGHAHRQVQAAGERRLRTDTLAS